MARLVGINVINCLQGIFCLIMLFPIACRAVGEVFGNSSSSVPMRVGLGTVFNATLDGSEHLLSNNGLFKLLFQYWQDSGISYCMAGVAFTRKTPGIMWSFNPHDPAPILGSSCVLNLSSDGVLLLQNDHGIAWQTNTSGGGVHSLVLQDDGNLVLESKDGQLLWQSFNETTFVILPGVKHFTKRDTLYERKQVNPTKDFSVPGKFGMRLSHVGGEICLLLFLRESMFVYYSLSPATTQNRSLAEETEYVVIGDAIEFYDSNASLIGSIAGNLKVVPDVGSLHAAYIHANDGHLQIIFLPVQESPNVQYLDMPSNDCENPFHCSAGEYKMCDPATGKCSCPPGFEENSMNCMAADGSQNMVPIPVSFHPQLTLSQLGSDQAGCKGLCESNRTCNAALYDSNTRSCSLFPVLFTIKAGNMSSTSQVMMLKIPNSLTRTSSPLHVTSSAHIIGAFVGVSVFVSILCAGIVFFRIRRRRRNRAAHDELFLQELPRLPPRFSYRELQMATNDFSMELGVGGFGSVYKGVLASHGTQIAVKRLDQGGAAQCMDQFRAEVATIGRISHINLVILKGFCMEGVSRLLVYEFMARGSLDRWLFQKRGEEEGAADGTVVLDWETRCKIALHTARGLEYLHHQCGERIVHCDVKPENILLDEKFNAKVADFGLAKLIGADDHSFAMTTLKGTRGYLAPEWLQHATITAKSDVYSYGVVLLELISGRRCLDAEQGYLPMWALSIAYRRSTDGAACMDTGRVEAALLDERLRGQHVPVDELERVLLIGLACVNMDPEGRPTMASVVQMLEGLLDVGPLAEEMHTSLAASPGPAISEAYPLLQYSSVGSSKSVLSMSGVEAG